MLVLSRKPGESINIGDNIRITIVSISPSKVRVGITAPETVPIHRDDVGRTAPQSAPAEVPPQDV